MKKTVTINISGIIFSIDEDAYRKLSNYLSTIKSYFNKSEGRDEIMDDIEARIAEMLQELMVENKQVVTINDVNHIISIMGEPEAFIDLENNFNENYNTSAESTNTDGPKRLYRDGENKVIMGTCAGIAHYFGWDPVWVRLFFILIIPLWGTSVLIYLILGFIIPEARTTAEKLEMRGKPININSISQAVEEGINGFGDKISNFTDKRENSADGFKKFFNEITGFFGKLIRYFFTFLGRILRFSFRVMGKFIGLALILMGAGLLLSSLFGLLGLSNVTIFSDQIWSNYSIYDFNEIFFNDSFDFWIAFVGVILSFGVPFFAIAYAGYSILFQPKSSPKGIGFGMLGAWILGIICSMYVVLSTVSEFSKEEIVTETIEIEQPMNDTLVIQQAENTLKRYRSNHSYNDYIIKVDRELIYLSDVDIDILESRTDSFKVEIIKSAHGEYFDEAEERASNIDYSVKQDINLLMPSPFFSMPIQDKLRNQKVRVLVYVPMDKTVYLDKSVKYMLDDVSNVTHTYDRRMVNKFWTMKKEGLTCPNIQSEKNSFEQIRIQINQTEAEIPNVQIKEEFPN